MTSTEYELVGSDTTGSALTKGLALRGQAPALCVNNPAGATPALWEFAAALQQLLFVMLRLEHADEVFNRVFDDEVATREYIERDELLFWEGVDGDVRLSNEHHAAYSPVFWHVAPAIPKYVGRHYLGHIQLGWIFLEYLTN